MPLDRMPIWQARHLLTLLDDVRSEILEANKPGFGQGYPSKREVIG